MPEQDVEVGLAEPKHSEGRSLAVGLTSLFFILLQSACTAFMAISGLRLLIGIGSLAAATAGMKFLATLHGAALRIPMELFAIAGSVVNLYAVRRVRKLRHKALEHQHRRDVAHQVRQHRRRCRNGRLLRRRHR